MDATQAVGPVAKASLVSGFRLVVLEGPRPGRVWESSAERSSLGSHPSNDLCVDEPTVSRFHCEIRMGEIARVRDLGSRNGTYLDGVQVIEGCPRSGSLLKLGRITLRFELAEEPKRIPISARSEFGSLLGASVPMRAAFALLERAAQTSVHVLLEGETGTGKGRAAEAIHRAGARRDGPFIVVDCGAIPENLLESELFGHERGAFTGATGRRIGAFEEAEGGTIFLDEIGELAPILQPKLLRVLESREFKRIGANSHRTVDVRVIAATNRDLRAEVNSGRFRSDLYFRLAVVKILLPPLRDRREDIPALAERIFANAGADPATIARFDTPEFTAALMRATWPGNVRELRNHLERCLVFEEALPCFEPTASTEDPAIDARARYADARRRALDTFERSYLSALLVLHHGNVAQAAAAAEIDRVYLHKLLRRHGLRAERGRE